MSTDYANFRGFINLNSIPMVDLLQKDETYDIIGAAMEVHRILGPGFLEAVYQEALEAELTKRKIDYCREEAISIYYKDIKLNKKYFADFIIYDSIIVELKALKELNNDHKAQLINYLKATGYEVGLLINFGAKSLQYKRLILSS